MSPTTGRRIAGGAVVAAHPGHCERCEQPFPRGALITLGRHGWQHATCPDGWE